MPRTCTTFHSLAYASNACLAGMPLCCIIMPSVVWTFRLMPPCRHMCMGGSYRLHARTACNRRHWLPAPAMALPNIAANQSLPHDSASATLLHAQRLVLLLYLLCMALCLARKMTCCIIFKRRLLAGQRAAPPVCLYLRIPPPASAWRVASSTPRRRCAPHVLCRHSPHLHALASCRLPLLPLLHLLYTVRRALPAHFVFFLYVGAVGTATRLLLHSRNRAGA